MLEYTVWKIVDSHWVNASRQYNDELLESNSPIDLYLSEYLWYYRFDIPETITYCLAENENWKLKFRHYGGTIHIYISNNN